MAKVVETLPEDAEEWVNLVGKTVQQINVLYQMAKVGLSDALWALIFDHGMDHNEAMSYLIFGKKPWASRKKG